MGIRSSLGHGLGLFVLLGGLWGCADGMTQSETSMAIAPNEQWKMLQHEEIQLEIPPGFVAGLPGLQLEELQASLEAAGFGDRTDWLAQNAENIALLAFKKEGDQLATINVVNGGRSPKGSLESYVSLQAQKLETAGIEVVSKTIEADDAVGTLQISAADHQQTIYVYPSTENFWVVTYSGTEPFDAATLERSRRSVEILTDSE